MRKEHECLANRLGDRRGLKCNATQQPLEQTSDPSPGGAEFLEVPIVRRAGKVSRSFDSVLDRGGTDLGERLSQRGVIPLLEKYGLDRLREDQRGSVEITG